MDKNQVTGLVLISVILIAYLQFFAPEPELELPNQENIEKVDVSSGEVVISNDDLKDDKVIVLSDSIKQLQNSSKYGVFGAFINDNEKEIIIENNTSIFTFSNKGAVLKKVELKNYKTYKKEPLILYDNKSHQEELNIELKDGKVLDVNTLSFSSEVSDLMISDDEIKTISFKVQLDENKFIQKDYIITGNKYELQQKLIFSGLNNVINAQNVSFKINDKAKHFEKDMKQSRHRSMVTYMSSEEDFDDFGERSMDKFDEEIIDIKWFSFKQKFFSKAYIFDSPLRDVKIGLSTDETDSVYTKYFSANYKVDMTSGNSGMTLYYGPNQYDLLSDVGYDLEKNVYLGWSLFRYINEYIILPLFNFIASIFGNYGLVIFLLVLVIKIAIFPFTFKSYKGFAKMRVLKPELDKLKEECGDDNTKYQQEQMKVYQKFGVSPLSGCIPMVFQMPFLFALFQLFPNSIELRGKSFLWAEDLSSYDAFFTWGAEIPFLGNHISLFTLMMTASTIAYTYISQQMTPTATAPGQPNMKVMSYMMPLVFFFVLNDYASGLTYYYFLSNIITIGQQLISKNFINEDKILAKMHEYSKKAGSKKKSSFSKRLEDAMKVQQEKQKKKK